MEMMSLKKIYLKNMKIRTIMDWYGDIETELTFWR